MNAAWGAGGLTGALIAARIVSKDNETAAAVLGVLALGIFVAAVGISPWVWPRSAVQPAVRRE